MKKFKLLLVEEIEQVVSTKYLGLHPASLLSWSTRVNILQGCDRSLDTAQLHYSAWSFKLCTCQAPFQSWLWLFGVLHLIRSLIGYSGFKTCLCWDKLLATLILFVWRLDVVTQLEWNTIGQRRDHHMRSWRHHPVNHRLGWQIWSRSAQKCEILLTRGQREQIVPHGLLGGWHHQSGPGITGYWPRPSYQVWNRSLQKYLIYHLDTLREKMQRCMVSSVCGATRKVDLTQASVDLYHSVKYEEDWSTFGVVITNNTIREKTWCHIALSFGGTMWLPW